MADHWETQLLNALKTKLTTPPLASVTAARVYVEDQYPNKTAEFPGINLTVGNSQRRRVGTINLGSPRGTVSQVENVAVLLIEVRVRQDAGLGDMVRQIAKEIEQRWLPTPADRALGVDGMRDAELVAMGALTIDGDSDVATGQRFLQFQVTVRSFEGSPDQT